jgi:lipoprotein-releasing system ATP-binding protein
VNGAISEPRPLRDSGVAHAGSGSCSPSVGLRAWPPGTCKMTHNRMMQIPPAAAPRASRAARDPESRASGIDHSPLIKVQGLRKSYLTARGALDLFEDLDLEVETGELVAIVGQSGAGKSTLLHILGALDAPSSGTVYFASTNVTKLSVREAATFRNREIGYVWQFHYLLPEFTAQENVAMPLMARGVATREALASASEWLGEVGLEDRADHRAGELSGGEQQRVALARALVCRPRLLMADEPTGDLDGVTANRVFQLIEHLHSEHGLTSILVTHNMDLAVRCTRTLRLENGRLTEITDRSPKTSHAGN